MAKVKKVDVLYRVVKFEIWPYEAALAVLRIVSENLRTVWNRALEERQAIYKRFIEPLYDLLKKATNPAEEKAARKKIKEAMLEHPVTLFGQINALTALRRDDPAYAATPRNWQEETLDTLDGAYKSYFALRRNGDPDAKPPRFRREGNFAEIPGRFGFGICDGVFELRGGDGRVLRFAIPDYQQGKLGDALKVKKFTLYRDEHDLEKFGRYWVSLAYEIVKPQTQEFSPVDAVFVAVGASSIGVLSPKGEEVIPLWRPDKHWKPKVVAIEARMKTLTKGSRRWKRLAEARRKIFLQMGRQQKHNQRETVVRKLLAHGRHFVVNEVVIRSKEGKLADGADHARGGALGLNWAAQNTGSIARLVAQIEMKATENGGTVTSVKLPPPPKDIGRGHHNKLAMAKFLRETFLAQNG